MDLQTAERMVVMEHFFEGVIQNKRKILFGFITAVVICAFCRPLIAVNYDMNSYLPEDVASSVALDTMEEEFDGGIPNVSNVINLRN